MGELSGIGVLSAFIAGLISFLSPCVLPLVPGYVSFVAGQSVETLMSPGAAARRRLPVLGLSLCFVLGFSAVFIAFGASASAVGQLLATYRAQANIVGGVVIGLFGLFMLGGLRPGWLQRDLRPRGRRLAAGRPLSAFLLGAAFAFGWTPCIGPILGAILMISTTTADAGQGVALLAVYSAGLAVPFLAAALFLDRFLRHSRGVRRFAPVLQRGAGVVLILVGLAIATGYLTTLSLWLLQAMPWLARLG